MDTLAPIYPSPTGHSSDHLELIQVGLGSTVSYFKERIFWKSVNITYIERHTSSGVSISTSREKIPDCSAISWILHDHCNMWSSHRVPPLRDTGTSDYVVIGKLMIR
jgi:hypothetical protein